MKVGLPNTQFRLRRQPLSIKTLLTRIAGLLIAFELLTMSACLGNSPSTKTVSGTRTVSSTTTVPSTKTASNTTSMPAPVGTPTNQGPIWKLVWDDEFDGPQGALPDPNKWVPQIGGGGWTHQQLEYDTYNQNVYQDGQGNLILEARNSNPLGYQCWYGPCHYTSARITTEGLFSFTYGRLEARIKVPYGPGIWPGFWLSGDNCATVGWPACGEVDIMESDSHNPASVHSFAHGLEDFNSSYTLHSGAFSDGFHVFALQWDASHLYFSVDGNDYAVLNKAALKNQQDWVYNHPFNIILDIAVGGGWPGNPDSTTTFPQRMCISYMRLYAGQ